MLAVRTASAGKIAPFGLLPSRTGQPSHRFFLCGVGAELQFALFSFLRPLDLCRGRTLVRPLRYPTNRTCHATIHSPITTSAGIFPWESLSFRPILHNSFELLTLRGVRFLSLQDSRASTQIRVTQDAGQYLKRILGFHLIPSVSILHQSG